MEETNSLVGGLTPNITEEEIRNRFSAVKNLPIKSVDIILREDGICKGFGYVSLFIVVLTARYIETAVDNEEAVAQLIKLYNGAKWRGKLLK